MFRVEELESVKVLRQEPAWLVSAPATEQSTGESGERGQGPDRAGAGGPWGGGLGATKGIRRGGLK